VSVSVIATVLNEAGSIGRLIESLAAQSRPPDEVVIVDGGSTDGTVDALNAYAARGPLSLRVLSLPGSNISEGRNAAIGAAAGEIIASTDAGVRLSAEWLGALIAPFSDPQVQVASGFFVPDAHGAFEIAMGATVLPALSEISPPAFLPSSRSVAFRKAAWEAVGGYPAWLDYCEDLVFDLKLREQCGTFAFVPQAVVHFRPRSSLRAFFRQYYRYARGDGKADLWRQRHAVRYATYLVVLPGLLALGLWHTPLWFGALLAGAAGYTYRPYQRLASRMSQLPLAQKLCAIALVPCIRLVGDVGKMVGYPAGWAWRLRHRNRIAGIRWRQDGR
jgi:glycosyltransferase involved in cell wall biosynthesis